MTKSALGLQTESERQAGWVELFQESKYKGEVLVTVEVMNRGLAANLQVGSGRSAPNQHPYLPPPTGRFRFSLNPAYILQELLGTDRAIGIVLFILVTFVVPSSYFIYSTFLKPYIAIVLAFV